MIHERRAPSGLRSNSALARINCEHQFRAPRSPHDSDHIRHPGFALSLIRAFTSQGFVSVPLIVCLGSLPVPESTYLQRI